MDKKNAPDEGKTDMRMMYIGSALLVLIMLGGMGANMYFHHDPSTDIWGRSIETNQTAK